MSRIHPAVKVALLPLTFPLALLRVICEAVYGIADELIWKPFR